MPAVATNVGSIAEVINPDVGVVVDKVGDLKALENGVRMLAKRKTSGGQQKARTLIAERFDIDKVSDAYGRTFLPG